MSTSFNDKGHRLSVRYYTFLKADLLNTVLAAVADQIGEIFV